MPTDAEILAKWDELRAANPDVPTSQISILLVEAMPNVSLAQITTLLIQRLRTQ